MAGTAGTASAKPFVFCVQKLWPEKCKESDRSIASFQGELVKRLALVAVAVAMVTVVPAHASFAVPEPSGFVQLAAGLFVLGGLALFARKRVSSEEAE